MKSNFYQDLSREELLGTYLDSYYPTIFKDTVFKVERVRDRHLQHRGVDLLLKSAVDGCYFVDEKAQLDYLNVALPTFAFELSYLKKEDWHLGWLLDRTKLTTIYFLVTNICPLSRTDLSKGLTKLKITGIYRAKLLKLLAQKGLTQKRLLALDKEIRDNSIDGKITIPELDAKREGAFYFSKKNKLEQPINLVLKLDFLVRADVGSVLFEL